jgi:biopolymer transport protein ExbD
MAIDRAKASPEVAARLAGKKAIRSYARKLAEPEDIKDLNIIPMMDMMTIILVFFLKSFSVSVENITLGDDLMIPPSTSQVKPGQAVQVTITKKAIVVEGDPIAAVKRGSVDASVKRDGASGYLINPLLNVLQKHATRLKKIEKMTGGKMRFKGEMVLVADQTLPYRLVSEVLYTAGQAEFGKYRLLVLKGD